MTGMGQRLMDAAVGSCAETREQLSDRLDGELHGWRRLRVSMHLKGCDRCPAVFRSLRRTVEQVHELGRVDFEPAPEGSVTNDVLLRIREERPAPAADS